MLLEALVLTVCVQGTDGCSQSTSAYYEQSTELKALAERLDVISKNIMRTNEWLVYVGTPVYSIASKQPAKILIYKGTTFNVDPWNQSVGLQWNY